MSEILNKNFDFSNEYTERPDEIVRKICDELSQASKEYAKVSISRYDGAVVSYNRLGIAKALESLTTMNVDIQKDLGEIGDGEIKFETLITAPNIDNFCYRPFFMKYGIGGYPVKIIMEQTIADEVFGKEDSNYMVQCDNEEELKEIVIKVFNSSIIRELIQGIINETRRQLNVVIDKD